MKKFYLLTSLLIIIFLMSCGTPNNPESIIGGDGGYKIVSKYATSGYAQDIVIKDTVAFICQGQAGLITVSISNPNQPRFLSELTYGLRGYGYKIAKKDSIIYLATGTFGVNIVNVKDPFKPLIVPENRAISPAKNFHIMGDFLFTAVSEEGVNISKIVDPAHPDIRQTFFIPGFGQAVCTSADSNYLLIASGEVGLSIFDISDFQDGYNIYPLLGTLDTPGFAEDVIIHPNLPIAFVACGTGGLVIADYSDTNDVKIVGSFSTGGYAKEVFYQNNKVYVATELRGLQIIDVSNVTSPFLIGTVETEYALGLTADDKYIYVADEKEGLIVVSTP
ncbi:MAG: hypothetical protein OQJ93_02425 [Ignavibacteriaceae bacterium]|nr:hypothetical protein [Ignavibacteriaceae bacterium]